MSHGVRPRIGFVLERTLGHATHADNLRSSIGPSTAIDAVFSTVDYKPPAIPVIHNWTVQASLAARHAVREMGRESPLDALFVHTQVPAVLMPDVLARIPTVVSLDATPRQYDELGEHYHHGTGPRTIERLKTSFHRACFKRAARLVTWSEWAKAGLVSDYGVAADKVAVIPPGIDLNRWTVPPRNSGPSDDSATRVLFVGGDFARKGGLVLLEAARRLAARGVKVEFDVVTRDEVGHEASVTVHHGLTANSAELVELYRRADVFCLPTRADCLGIAFAEAGAMGIPSVATDIGGISEIVRDGDTGLLVPVDDAGSTAEAIERLAVDGRLRGRLGDRAHRLVVQTFNASTNADRLIDLLMDVAGKAEPDDARAGFTAPG